MRQQWDYKVVETKDRTKLQPELASAGAEGWELVSVTAMFNTLMTKVVYTLARWAGFSPVTGCSHEVD